MAINNWWQDDPSEVFWMEITDREDLGESLWAPQRDGSGGDSWSYTLLTYLQPGDRIFHWHRSLAGEPAIVGWSEVAGPLSVETKSWQAHGTRGRARGVPTVGPAWVVPLRGLVSLDRPVTRAALNARYLDVWGLLQESALLAKGPAYAPFQNYGGRELRAQQGYLTKFPAALVDFLFSATASESPIGETRDELVRVARSQGYMNDAEKRSALELYAIRLVWKSYEEQGATDIEELGKPYDLRVVIGGEERHVEVKGSTGIDLASVQLTQGEVVHAGRWQPTDLVVVDAIECWRDNTGVVQTSGGRLRVWRDWNPSPADLAPTHLRYALPGVS